MAAAMEMDNDTRGWIMCLVSGIACIFGASIICVDSLVRMFPGKRDFRIQDSNAFLASSLSLSFGVMLFMALYSMLPEAKSYLKQGGFSEQPASFILMGCFVGGFVGIQIVSRLFHQLLPSHVVDCDHSHDEHTLDGHSRPTSRKHSTHGHKHIPGENGNGAACESTPLLSADTAGNGIKRSATSVSDGIYHTHPANGRPRATTTQDHRRPSMMQVQKRVMSFVKDTKANCDESGPCYGYSDPCGQECFKHLSSRSAFTTRAPTFLRTTTGNLHHVPPALDEDEEDGQTIAPVSPVRRMSHAHSRDHVHHLLHHDHQPDSAGGQEMSPCECDDEDGMETSSEDLEAQHHHHVPENAFLSIGLQTSIAIALHKFPEGFITYATNHANPSLGFNVFLALFVHNISEGFALALPLYMALNNRLRAMLWSSLLGGLSQPLGAGIAVLAFKVSKHTHMTPDAVAYGCLFAATAGIMASVALQLFVESLSLNHNQNLSILFAFLGMALLGLSSAFTSAH